MQYFRVLVSILTDISKFLPEKGRKEEREKERKKEVKDPRAMAELKIM